MKKLYVSNSTDSVRMFKSNWMEALSKVHFSIPLFIYVPVIAVMTWLAFDRNISIESYFLLLGAGVLIWTVTEYILHRFVFHFEPASEWGKRIHFIFHGVHHDYPKDTKRLVMPPSASIPIAILFYFLFSLVFTNKTLLYPFFAGFIAGYLVYDMLHYAMHHYNFKSNLMKRIKQHHMLHHYDDPTKGYGVSSSLWDVIFQSGFPKKKK
ncbi:fatty acid hydroxylase [Niastella yeongjuensis]|uniref:Fatty acid hydroxylase n=1 Tax=Niastella yeongjuensis TaxID=354355 RepID=A0A1V9E1Q0_9BACT|nr:sterol desaturase family protein [Niastella yeongjuensis]OQP39991.1 fatty acid hydroxylase [Niastella yeongjuensis]SEO12817.1 Fatty acid hydroxylase superfamily protein [Niastella yeongjuensis]